MSAGRAVSSEEFDWAEDTGPAADLRAVIESAEAADGTAPVDEATVLELRHGLGESRLWAAGRQAFAWRHGSALDVVVAPAAREQGLGRALATTAASEPGELSAWSHGNHPAAARLAEALGFHRVRDLWVMRRPLLNLPTLGPPTEGIVVRPFEVGTDEDAFLRVNAAAFAHHPEQGSLDRAGLDERMAESWFDPEGFLVAERGSGPDRAMLGFHWTKVHDGTPPVGEVYVVGVSPDAQGLGLGPHLTLAGLHYLAARGLGQVELYVEADNSPAIKVYSRLGFTHAESDTHVQYRRA